MFFCKARGVNKPRKYVSPELRLIGLTKEDILTLSGDVKEGVGIQWSWTFENPFEKQEAE